jgi:programmed cell death protein 4
LHPDILSTNVIGKGFERLFELIDDIEKDAPFARNILSTYLARAVVDEVLPPSFLNDAVVINLGGEIVEHAKRMLSSHHNGAKLEKIWGPGDGRPVEEIKIAIEQLLQEYITSSDLVEAVRCVKELDSSQFLHEVVKKAVITAIDLTSEKRQAMSILLAQLVVNEILTQQQATIGFNRLKEVLNDLKLDSPNAASILNEFVEKAKIDNVLPLEYI